MPVGTKLQVFRGTKTHTRGGLTKNHLKRNKRGKIVSKKASAFAKKQNNLGNFLVGKRSKGDVKKIGEHPKGDKKKREKRVRNKPKRFVP
jgi:hypothetical protein